MFVREKRISGYTYLYLVETVREHGRAKQRIIKNLGRKEALAASGALERLASSVARYAERAVVLSQLETGNPERLACKRIGAPLLFGRLWEETGCRAVIEDLLSGRAFEFPVERAVFATVLHRIMVSGSDRACEKWLADYDIPGVDGLALHHFYRAMAWLGEELPAEQQGGATPVAPRTVKDLIEEQLFRSPAGPVQRAVGRVHGHHVAELCRRRRPEPRRAGLFQGPPAGSDADDPGRGDRRRWSPGLLGELARQHRRCRRPGAGDRSPAQPLRHRPGLRRGRPRHDLGGHHHRARGARPGIRARRVRAHRHAGAHRRAGRQEA